MNTDTLLERFKRMLSMEEKIKDTYNYYIERLEDATIKQQLISIRNDEKIHEDIVKKMIEYISHRDYGGDNGSE